MSLALSAKQTAPTYSEHELIAAVRGGDDNAFGELFARYQRRIGAYVSGMVGDHARAEDITQEVFISALQQMRETERPILLKPWLYRIAKNACIDDFRRARRANEVPLEGDDQIAGGNPRLFAREPTAEAAAENRQRLDDLRGAFRGLSESHHQVIVLREFEGRSYGEIGERLGMSKAMVESTLFRARQRLGEEYEELVSGRRCEHVQAVISERHTLALRSLGIKQRRLISRHLAHCQPCRRVAHLAGVDQSVFKTPGLVGKIAALLPIPTWLRFRRQNGGPASGLTAGSSHPISALQSFALTVNPAAAPGLGRVAAAAATLVAAGAGGGLVTSLAASSASHRAPTSSAAAAAVSVGRALREQATAPAGLGAAGQRAAGVQRSATARGGRSSAHRTSASALSSPRRGSRSGSAKSMSAGAAHLPAVGAGTVSKLSTTAPRSPTSRSGASATGAGARGTSPAGSSTLPSGPTVPRLLSSTAIRSATLPAVSPTSILNATADGTAAVKSSVKQLQQNSRSEVSPVTASDHIG